MKKSTIILVLLVFSSALTLRGQVQKDPYAEKVLNAVAAKYKSMKSFKASFTFKMHNAQVGLDQTMKGTATVKGEKYRIKTGGQEIINNGKTVWTLTEEDGIKEALIADYEPDEDEITISNIYSIYKKGYKYLHLGDETVGGVAYTQIELIPEDKDQSVFKIKMRVGKTDNLVYEFVMFEKSGNRYTYKVDNFKENVDVSDAYFSYDCSKHPDVDCVDLRD